MYRAKRYDEAVSLFQFFFTQSSIVPNIVSYNFLICTHCECGKVDVGLEVYRKILAEAPFGPSAVTYRHLTKGLIDAGRIGEAVDMLREMLNKGLGADSLVYNNLIKGFLDLEDFDKANEFFDELKERCLVYDGVVNATFMEWFFNRGRGKEAMESYRSLLDRQFKMIPATCNVLLEVLLRHGKKKEAWELFDSMLDNHTPPNFQAVNSDTFNIMVNECFKEGKFDEAVDAFRKVGTKMGSRPFAMDVAGYNNIIVRFAEHGMTLEAEKFFAELQSKSLSPDVTGYRTLIDAYLKEQRIDDALQMFHRMVDANLRVIPQYANRWFTELIQNNKAVECSYVLTKMGEREPKPDATTYEIVIKGLCQVGAVDVTIDMVGQIMRYGVGVTPVLREYLLDVFTKEGRREEMERLLDERRQGYMQQPRPQSSGPLRPAGPGQFQRPVGPPGFQPPRGPPGFPRQAGPIGYPGQAGPVGHPGPAGNVGHPGQAGAIGHPGSAVPTGHSASPGPVGYTHSAGFSGNPPSGGHTGMQSSTGPPPFPRLASFSGPGVRHPEPTAPTADRWSAGHPGSTSPGEYPCAGPAGYPGSLRPGPSAYPGSFGPGPSGYPPSAGDAGLQSARGPAVFPGQTEHTEGEAIPAEPRGYTGHVFSSSG